MSEYGNMSILLEHEKSGIGPKRMARASAFLEAASVLDQMSCDAAPRSHGRAVLEKAADKMRDKAVAERMKFDDEQHREAKEFCDL